MPSQIVNPVHDAGTTQRQAITLTEVAEENMTSQITFTLQLVGGGAIPNTDLTAVTLSLIDEETLAIINSRQDQDVLGAGMTGQNNVVISATSDFTFNLQAADNVIKDPSGTKKLEYHRARFTFDYDNAGNAERHIVEFRFPVRKQLVTLLLDGGTQ
jgi:hypothetical protein